MELQNKDEFESHIKQNYELLFSADRRGISTSDLPGKCDYCGREVYLKLGASWHGSTYNEGLPEFAHFFIQCPSCKRQSFISCIVLGRYEVDEEDPDDEGHYFRDMYKLYQVPTQEADYDLRDVPTDLVLLRSTIREAKGCMNNGYYTASAIMYRRALQVLAKQVLGSKGRTLYQQLKWLEDNTNNLNEDLSSVFHENGKLIREVGNQGAHPEEDEDLQTFSKEDTEALHDLLIVLITEVFVKPARLKEIQESLKSRRKLQ
jgi:hypothetical protein